MKKREYWTTLKERCEALIEKHGGLRAAARAVDVERSYFYRMATGQKDNPSSAVLRKLGLRREITYWIKL